MQNQRRLAGIDFNQARASVRSAVLGGLQLNDHQSSHYPKALFGIVQRIL